MNLNKALIGGRLTRDPELKSLPSGTSVVSFSLATNHYYKDASGNKQEQVEFHNVTTFGKVAENCGLYLKKGQEVLVEGRIQTRSWDDKKTGEKKYRTEIIGDIVQFGSQAAGIGHTTKTTTAPEISTIEYPEEEDGGIPF